jgi:hypothetical protein
VITKNGFKERIARNMGIDPTPKGLTREKIMGMFCEEAEKEAKTSKLFDKALEEMVKDGILIRKSNGRYSFDFDNPDFDC